MLQNELNINLSIESNLKITSDIMQKRMSQILFYNNGSNNLLLNAIKYMLLSNGRMIRPFLVLATSYIYIKNVPENIIDLAIAIEMIHTYTLIHDDLPAMDDSDYRRKRLSCHKKFDEATAILSGNALLTLAFEILSSKKYTSVNSNTRLNIINELTKLIGFKGILLGQKLDLDYDIHNTNASELKKIRILKTSKLFIASCKFAAMANRAKVRDIDALSLFAEKLGLAYQIKDDIDDNDHQEPKETLKDLVNESLQHLDVFNGKGLMLKGLVKHLF